VITKTRSVVSEIWCVMITNDLVCDNRDEKFSSGDLVCDNRDRVSDYKG
jgi:hypothetical protein